MKSNANIDYAYLAELLFPDVTETEADLEERYPPAICRKGLSFHGLRRALRDLFILETSYKV